MVPRDFVSGSLLEICLVCGIVSTWPTCGFRGFNHEGFSVEKKRGQCEAPGPKIYKACSKFQEKRRYIDQFSFTDVI